MDILGNNRISRAPSELGSSEFALITLGNGTVSLSQSFSGNLRQQVRPMFVLGDSSLYWTFGYSEGAAEVSRLAGGQNFFDAFQAGQCGIVHSLNLDLQGGKPCAPNNGGLRSLLRFTDGIIEQLSIRMQAGQTEIQESASMRFANVMNQA